MISKNEFFLRDCPINVVIKSFNSRAIDILSKKNTSYNKEPIYILVTPATRTKFFINLFLNKPYIY